MEQDLSAGSFCQLKVSARDLAIGQKSDPEGLTIAKQIGLNGRK